MVVYYYMLILLVLNRWWKLMSLRTIIIICLLVKDLGHYRFAFQDLVQAPVVVSRRPLEEDLGTEPAEEDAVSLPALWTLFSSS